MPPIDNTTGFWSPHTSTIDWCESNYEISYYIVEFFNTISGLSFVWPPLVAAYKLSVANRYLMALLAFTGLGSMAFHGTLRYPMQLWDELAMMYTVMTVLYLALNVIQPNKQYGAFIVAYGLCGSILYNVLENPIIYQLLFGTALVFALVCGHMVASRGFCSKQMFYFSVIGVLLAFGLWLIDLNQCETLIKIRSRAPWLTRWTFQFHALWHLFAGYACYCLILCGIQADQFVIGKKMMVTFDASTWGVMLSDRKTFY